MRAGSVRWWFENRETGQLIIAQFPNWPLFAIGAGWIVRALAADGSSADGLARAAIVGLWLYWGADELVRGVNPWRRTLGLGVIAWQVVALIR